MTLADFNHFLVDKRIYCDFWKHCRVPMSVVELFLTRSDPCLVFYFSYPENPRYCAFLDRSLTRFLMRLDEKNRAYEAFIEDNDLPF